MQFTSLLLAFVAAVSAQSSMAPIVAAPSVSVASSMRASVLPSALPSASVSGRTNGTNTNTIIVTSIRITTTLTVGTVVTVVVIGTATTFPATGTATVTLPATVGTVRVPVTVTVINGTPVVPRPTAGLPVITARPTGNAANKAVVGSFAGLVAAAGVLAL